jgi:diacylglycerol kinase (ATP)
LKRKALFIINPVSGGKKKDAVPDMVDKNLDKTVFDYQIVYSDGVSHAHVIAADARNRFDLIVAVGGDGTVNEVASGIAGSNTALGILPFGSGNGLSRFLGIPMDAGKAIKNLNNWNLQSIDAAKVDGEWFFNIAGMGFDAHISEVFSHKKARGFGTYIKSSFSEVVNYKAENYRIVIDGKVYEREAFMVSFANSSQYGNNAHVSPGASIQDGMVDVCIIKPFPLWRFIGLGIRMFTKTTHKSKYVEIIRGKHIVVNRQNAGPLHLDGEPRIAGAGFIIEVLPSALKIITGQAYRKH